MRRFRALILCMTILVAYLGMDICEKSLSTEKKETIVSHAVEVTSTVSPSKTVSSTPSPSPTNSLALLEDGYEVKPVVEQEPDVNKEHFDFYEEIEIPPIEIAGLNDVEDPVPVNKRTPAQLNNHTVNVKEVKTSAYNSEKSKIGNSDYELVTRVGIDVSQWNEKIDWKKVADSGVEFAMIRIGYRGSVYGKIVLDHYFYDNIEGALANGIDVGIYFYSQAINEEEAIQEAAWLCDIIKKYNVTYPVAYDLEEVEINRIATVSFEQLNKNAVAFLNYVASKGYTPCMYGCKSYLENVWDMKLYNNCYVWVAHVGVTQTTYKGRYDMWQYSWTGRIPGIPENVDMNIEYKWVSKKPVEEKAPLAEEPAKKEPVVEPVEKPTLEQTTEPEMIETMDIMKLCSEATIYSAMDSSAILASLAEDTEVNRIGYYENGYSKISYNGGTAYVLTSQLSEIVVEITPVEEDWQD